MSHLAIIPAALGAAFLLVAADGTPPQADKAIPATTPAPAVAAARPHLRPTPKRFRHRPSSPALLRVAAANAAATLEPAREAYINAVQVYPFADGAIYQVYAAPERVTDIALQPGEVLGAVAAGDTVRWIIGDTSSGTGAEKRTHVLLKPFTSGLSTNILITTDRRSYHLTLTSTAKTAMAALSWTYPQDALIALKREQAEAEATAPVSSGLALDQLHFNYAVSGDQPAWRPLRTFDDGRQTFIEFPASLAVGEAPPLFLVDGKGVAQLVNYRVQGRFYIVDRLFDAAELRLGTKHQDIVRIARVADDGQRRRGS